MNEQFIKRLKSLAWKTGHFMVIGGLAFFADNLATLEINPLMITIVSAFISFATGEITKWWAIKQATLGKTFFGRALV